MRPSVYSQIKRVSAAPSHTIGILRANRANIYHLALEDRQTIETWRVVSTQRLIGRISNLYISFLCQSHHRNSLSQSMCVKAQTHYDQDTQHIFDTHSLYSNESKIMSNSSLSRFLCLIQTILFNSIPRQQKFHYRNLGPSTVNKCDIFCQFLPTLKYSYIRFISIAFTFSIFQYIYLVY